MSEPCLDDFASLFFLKSKQLEYSLSGEDYFQKIKELSKAQSKHCSAKNDFGFNYNKINNK